MRPLRGTLACLFLSVIGVGLCVYLTFLHLALLRGELVGGAACGAAGTIFNCHAVTASPLGSLLGVPLSLWGLLGYLATLTLAFIAWQFSDWSEHALTCLLLFSLTFVVMDVGLLIAMVTQIHYLCPLCLASYLLNVGLVGFAKHALAQSWSSIFKRMPITVRAWLPAPGVAVVWVFWGVLMTGTMGVMAVHAAATYLIQGAPGALRKQMVQFVTQQHRVSVDISQDPMQGVSNGAIQVVEFSDFLCPSCQRAFQLNPIILASHRKEMTFVFKHFPLDMTCNRTVQRVVHPNACQIAAASECAHEQGKFWEFHDLIFQKGSPYKVTDLETDAAKVKLNMETFRACLQSGRGLEAVKRDIEEAARLGVTSTPTYIINGLPILGMVTPTTFEELLHALRQSGH